MSSSKDNVIDKPSVIEVNAFEAEMLRNAVNSLMAQVKRSINAERQIAIRHIREDYLAKLSVLLLKL